MATGNRWGRAIGAGVLEQLTTIVATVLWIVLYAKLGPKVADRMTFVHWGGAWSEVVGSVVVMFLFTRWALRPLTSAHVPHALVVTAVAVAIHLGIDLQAVAEGHLPLWVVVLADVLKVGTGVGVALLARRNVSANPTIAA